jgi:hypothetical protein
MQLLNNVSQEQAETFVRGLNRYYKHMSNHQGLNLKDFGINPFETAGIYAARLSEIPHEHVCRTGESSYIIDGYFIVEQDGDFYYLVEGK